MEKSFAGEFSSDFRAKNFTNTSVGFLEVHIIPSSLIRGDRKIHESFEKENFLPFLV